MKDELANELLSKVLGWSETEGVTNLQDSQVLIELQHLARYKYDDYLRFSPGSKFIESLATWLNQFERGEEREDALEFVKRRLIFVSEREIHHLAEILHPEYAKPRIRQHVANELGLAEYQISAIESSPIFKQRSRETLYLGLSDGARIDIFRRSTKEVDHEQVYPTYEVAQTRLKKMKEKLEEHLPEFSNEDLRFRFVFLIDDFSDSGTSLKSKINGFATILNNDKQEVFNGPETKVYVCIYIASRQALDYVKDMLRNMKDTPWGEVPEVFAIQILEEDLRFDSKREPGFDTLLNRYYDPSIMNEHLKVGGDSAMYGFADCRLQIMLPHNTPNNSISLLWAPEPMTALFPRLERHAGQASDHGT